MGRAGRRRVDFGINNVRGTIRGSLKRKAATKKSGTDNKQTHLSKNLKDRLHFYPITSNPFH